MSGDWLDRLAQRTASRVVPPQPEAVAVDPADETLTREALVVRGARAGVLLLAGTMAGPAAARAARPRATACGFGRVKHKSFGACIRSWADGNYARFVAECDRNWDRGTRPGALPGSRDPRDLLTPAEKLAGKLNCFDGAYKEWARVAAICRDTCPPEMPRPRKPKPKPPPPKDSTPPPPPPSGGEDGTCAACLAVGGVCCLGGGGVVRRGERIPPGASICGCNNPDYPCRC